MNFTIKYLSFTPQSSYCLAYFKFHDTSQELKYCGTHSQIIFYALGTQPEAVLVVPAAYYIYDLSMKYMVTDSSQNITIWTDDDYPSFCFQNIYPMSSMKNILSHKNSTTAIYFHILVSKLDIIHLHMRSLLTLLEIYDGPGIFSPSLKSFQRSTVKTLYISSTFQIFILYQNNKWKKHESIP